MTMKRCVVVVAMSGTLILALWAAVCAADKTGGQAPQAKYAEKQSETLKGVDGVYVLVDKLNPVVEQLGLTRESLRVDTELQLRQFGIKILDADQWLKTPNAADLHIVVNVMPLNEDTFPLVGVSIEIGLEQQVWLVRDPTMRCSAATWHTSAAARVPRARLVVVREVVKDNVAKFVNDYLAMNPKPPANK